MCLGQCFEKGLCLTTLPAKGYQFKDEGTALRYRRVWSFSDGSRTVHGSTEWRSFYSGDSEWKKNADGSVTIKEHHNIELLALQLLVQDSTGVYRTAILRECQTRLKSPDLYDAFIINRMNSLVRRKWVTEDNDGHGVFYAITGTGKIQYAHAVSKRFKF
jgi:hypothetical protein